MTVVHTKLPTNRYCSGDTDRVVPVTGSRYAINKLGTPVKRAWYPWYTHDEVSVLEIDYISRFSEYKNTVIMLTKLFLSRWGDMLLNSKTLHFLL